MEYTREVPKRPPRQRARQRLVRDLSRLSARQTSARKARAAWIAACPSATRAARSTNIIPDWNDLVYRGRWREAIRAAALHQQLPGIHRPHLPGAVRGRLRPGHHRAAGDDQADREDASSTAVGRRDWIYPEPRPRGPASAWRWWARDRRDWRRRSNWRARGMRRRFSRRPTASAGCCATASPISRWRST